MDHHLSPENNGLRLHDLREPFDLNFGLLIMASQKFVQFWNDYGTFCLEKAREKDPDGLLTITEGEWNTLEGIRFWIARCQICPEKPKPRNITLQREVT